MEKNKRKKIIFSEKLLENAEAVFVKRKTIQSFLRTAISVLLILVMIFSGWPVFLNHSEAKSSKDKTENKEKKSVEIESKRTYTSKTFMNPDGTYALEAHIGQIHYKEEKTGKIKEVDTTLEDKGERWTMEKASYHAQIPKFADEPMEFQDVFEDKDQAIIMIPQTGHILGSKENSDGWKNKRIRYENAFGEGIDLRVTVGNVGLFKEVIVNKKPEKTDDLSFDFEIILPEGKDVFVLSGEAKKPKKINSLNNFELTGNDQLLIGEENGDEDSFTKIQKIRVWDSEGNITSGKLRFYEKDGKIFFQKIVPKEFLETAVFPVYTDDTLTPIYSGAGDGYVDKGNSTNWDTTHDATTGITADYTGSTALFFGRTGFDASNNYIITRAFFPIDTSGLSASATVTAATLYMYVTSTQDADNDGKDYEVLVQTDQPSSTALTTSDFNNCGSVDSPAEGSVQQDITGISVNQYYSMALNSTPGLGWIKKNGETSNCGTSAGVTCLGVREGHDTADEAYAGATNTRNRLNGYYSEYTGTGSDPYLSVTYTLPPDLTWVTGSADFEIFASSSLTWDAGSSVCSGTLTDSNSSTISCTSGALAASTQYRVQVLLKNAGGGAASMNGASDYVDHVNVKAGWAGANPTLGNCAFYDANSDNGSTTCTAAWNSTNDVRITNTGAGNVVLAATTGTEGFSYLITTDSYMPNTNSTSYYNSSIDANAEDSSKITITGPTIVSITLTSDKAVAYGNTVLDSEKNTTASGLNDTQTAQNNGNITENFNIKTSHAVGGTQWSVGGSAGSDTFVHSFSTNGGSSWEVLQTYDNYETLATGISVNGTQNFDLKIHTPTATSDFQQKTITATVQAVQP